MNWSLFLREFSSGITNYKKAFDFLLKNKLLAYYLAPLVVAFLFTLVSILGISIFTDWLDDLFQQWFGITVKNTSFDIIKDYKEFFSGAGTVVITILLKIIMYFLVFRVNKYVTLIILSPVLAYLSEKVEMIITGKEYVFNPQQFLKDVWRGVFLALRNMTIEFIWVIALWSATFMIPLLLPFTAIILFLVSAYYYGFSMMDYTNERKRLSIRESIHYIQKHKGLTLGNGVVYQIIISFPFIGAVIAPITAVVAATLSVFELDAAEY
jgi:CysZ protein